MLLCGAVRTSEFECPGCKSSISQTFIAPKGTLAFRIRYQSEAYRFSPINTSDFSVRIETCTGIRVLAEGNANNFPEGDPPPEDCSFGLIPYSEEMDFYYDLTGLEGEAVRLVAEIREDGFFEGTLGISNVEVGGQEDLYFHSSHLLSLPTTINIEAGALVELVFKNNGSMLSIFTVRDVKSGKKRRLVIRALSSKSVRFAVFACPPVEWMFYLRTALAINPFVFLKAYSTWVPGMPL